MRMGKTTAKAIIECIKAIENLTTEIKTPISSEKVHKKLRMSFEYVNDAIEAALMLQFIKNGETLTLSSEGQKLISSTSVHSQLLFKEQLLKLPTITQLIKLISDGNNYKDAVSKIIKLHKIRSLTQIKADSKP